MCEAWGFRGSAAYIGRLGKNVKRLGGGGDLERLYSTAHFGTHSCGPDLTLFLQDLRIYVFGPRFRIHSLGFEDWFWVTATGF